MREIKILTEKCMGGNIVLDMMYPPGSIYVSLDKDFNPNEWWGGVWQLLKEGQFLEATETADEVGKEVEPGLPNITGVSREMVCHHSNTFTGALQITKYYRNIASGGLDGLGIIEWKFNAGRSNPIYKDDIDTVQPKSIRCFIWRRIS